MKRKLVGVTTPSGLLLAAAVLLLGVIPRASFATGTEAEPDDISTADGLGMRGVGRLPWIPRGAIGYGRVGFGPYYPIPPDIHVRECIAKAIKKCMHKHHHNPGPQPPPRSEDEVDVHATASVNHHLQEVGGVGESLNGIYSEQAPMPLGVGHEMPVDPNGP